MNLIRIVGYKTVDALGSLLINFIHRKKTIDSNIKKITNNTPRHRKKKRSHSII